MLFDLVAVYCSCSCFRVSFVSVVGFDFYMRVQQTVYNHPGLINTVLLFNRRVRLNGRLLQLANDSVLPKIEPLPIKRGNPMLVPPLSYGFYVVPEFKAKACLSESFIPRNKCL